MSSRSINNVILQSRRFCMHPQLFTFRGNPMAALRSTTRTAIYANTGRAHTNGCACLYARWVDALKAPVKRGAGLAFGGGPSKRREVATHQPAKHGLVTDMPSARNKLTSTPALRSAQNACPSNWRRGFTNVGATVAAASLRMVAAALILRRGAWHPLALRLRHRNAPLTGGRRLARTGPRGPCEAVPPPASSPVQGCLSNR